VPLGGAHRSGLPVLRAPLAASDVDGNLRDVLSVADENGDATLRIRAGDGDWAVGTAQRIYGRILQVVDGGFLDPVLAPLRAFHPVLPGEYASVLVRRNGAAQRRSDLDPAHRAASLLQHD